MFPKLKIYLYFIDIMYTHIIQSTSYNKHKTIILPLLKTSNCNWLVGNKLSALYTDGVVFSFSVHWAVLSRVSLSPARLPLTVRRNRKIIHFHDNKIQVATFCACDCFGGFFVCVDFSVDKRQQMQKSFTTMRQAGALERRWLSMLGPSNARR